MRDPKNNNCLHQIDGFCANEKVHIVKEMKKVGRKVNCVYTQFGVDLCGGFQLKEGSQ